MKLRFAAVLVFAAAALFAEVQGETPAPEVGLKAVVKKCQVCDGKGKLVLSPPDKGQHAGSGMSKRHWDVTSECPVCDGKGKRKTYRTFLRVKDAPEGMKACPNCGWAGCKPCRKCKGGGIVPCKCRGCENGWIITKSDQLMSGKRRRPPTVTPCPECRGVGKVKCQDCEGTGGEPCRKCNGEGLDPKSRQ